MTPLRLAALIAGLVVLAAPAAWAQATQGFGRTGQLSGACGQPLALTYTLALPVDEVAAEALDVEILRAEPFYVEFTLARESRTVLRTETRNKVPSTAEIVYVRVLDTPPPRVSVAFR